MAEPITIEAQVKELVRAGWTQRSLGVWIAPSGAWYIGPHGAWKVMRGIDAAGAPRTVLEPAPNTGAPRKDKDEEADLGA